MTMKRALVVDDSKAARLSLKRLLSDYDLDIELAASGEEALEYLKKHSVDVVFMDHTMPGMDGLEAVSAIKANPKTATIPVMMYTTKEGEVYVGQARALGAVGVLPKNVQPHQLFEMLSKLGLVQERRDAVEAEDTTDSVDLDAAEASASANVESPFDTDALRDLDRVLEDQAQGIALQSVVRRILEDQHMILRSDVLRSQRAFAKDVAREVLREHQVMEGAFLDDLPPPASNRNGWVTAAAVSMVVVSAFFAFQFKNQRDTAIDALAAYRVADTQMIAEADVETVPEASEQLAEVSEPESILSIKPETIAALQSSLNRDNNTGLYGAAFNADLAAKLETVVPYLEQMGFDGEVRLTSHLGRFCLTVSDQGSYELAPADLPVSQCAHMGHVLDTSNFVNDRMDPDFATTLARLEDKDLDVKPVALYMDDSVATIEYPGPGVSAAEWNAIAKINNRVEVELIPRLMSKEEQQLHAGVSTEVNPESDPASPSWTESQSSNRLGL